MSAQPSDWSVLIGPPPTHSCFLSEIQSRRQERKRRTTANPVYSGAVFEPEVRNPPLGGALRLEGS